MSTQPPAVTRHRPGRSPGHPRLRGLMGVYPVPELHLVGAPVPADPRSPGQWRPTAPAPQYGIDYSFATGSRGRPLTWRPGRPILIRATGVAAVRAADAIAGVTAELAHLTHLDLQAGEPRTARLDPHQIPSQEIHVALQTAPAVADGRPVPCAGPGGPAGSAGAAVPPGGRYYESGYAIVRAAGTAAELGRGGDGPALAALRHQMAHALGLGHASRPSLLMHWRIPAIPGGYGRGDRHGLALLSVLPPPEQTVSFIQHRRNFP